MLYVGTSGWEYAHWRGSFYPRRPAPRDTLAFYAARFPTVELNGTFYRLPARETFESWARRTPRDFVFAMKASRYLTHILRLREPQEAVRRMLERAQGLGDKLGPLLLQLPPTLERDAARLDGTLELIELTAPGTRVAVEFRHASWWRDETRRLLERRGAALCLADRGSRIITPEWRTADWGYVRFHEGLARPRPCYGRWALQSWAQRIRRLYGVDADVYAYFNNDASACAIRDAETFTRIADAVGIAAAARVALARRAVAPASWQRCEADTVAAGAHGRGPALGRGLGMSA
ncbi:MAG TPA: DUF72 domain-containing protein [Dehalococcoidia bacterium]|nr:DUF72 domain-containing protein [Dehalococcoidia bacterium]